MAHKLLYSKKQFLTFVLLFCFFKTTISQIIIRDTLYFTGNEQVYIIPCGVNTLTIDAFGANGANGTNNPNNGLGGSGGLGSHIQTQLTVNPGQTFSVFVGGKGIGATGGFNGGGMGGINVGGGGGGASDIRFGGNSISNRIIVAGGGGGGGAAGCEANDIIGGNGGDGGGGAGGNGLGAFTPAVPNFNPPLPAGIAGGGYGGVGNIGGNYGDGCNGFNGTVGGNAIGSIGGNGGNAPTCCCFSSYAIPGGGGGGGGFVGGGGGGGGSAGTLECNGSLKGAGGGGAGGTNFVDSSFTNTVIFNGVNNGNGYVVFSYTNPIPSTPETTTFITSICSGTIVSYEVSLVPNATTYTWTVTGDLNIVSGQGTDSITVTGTGNNGSISVIAENSCGTSAPSTLVMVSINQNPLLSIVESNFSVCPGELVTLEASGADTYSWTGGVENNIPFTPTITQTYTVTGTNTASGCSAELSQEVTVNPAPNPTVISSEPSPFCAGENVTLTGNPTGGTFAVTSGDASALQGNTFNAAAEGSWVIEYNVTNAEGCDGTETINLSTNCTVNLNQLCIENALTIYPNPTKDVVTFVSPAVFLGKEYQLIDQAGRELVKGQVTNVIMTLSLKHLTNGIYILKTEDSQTIKIVKN